MRPVNRPTPAPLTLQGAADALGVHYQTAYKWVRSGQLPATSVRGRYVVVATDVEAFRNRRDQATSAIVRRRPVRVDGRADQAYDALVSGDEGAVRRMAVKLVAEGLSIVALIQEVLVPPLVRIGTEWRAGRLSIWVEHRASAIVERLLGSLHPNHRGRRRGTVVVAALSGDHHALPTAMAAAALRDDNWHVHHLGCDVPAGEIEDFARIHHVDLVVLTVTASGRAADADRLASTLERRGVRTLVGAPGRTLDELLASARLR